MGMPRYTIGELARAADVPTTTVRYYERRGLLTPTTRSRGNYRLYGEASLERLGFIRSAQAAGFTLGDIMTLLRFREGETDHPCREVQNLITARLERVREELDHLKEVETLLKQWMSVCRAAQRTGRCGVLERLSTVQKRNRRESQDSA